MTRVLAAVLILIIGGTAWFTMWQPLYETGRKLSTWIPVEVERTTKTVLRQGGPTIRGMAPATVVAVIYRYKIGETKYILPPNEDPPLEEIGPIFREHAEKMEVARRKGLPMPEGMDEVVDKVNGYANPAKPEELHFHHPRFSLLFPKLLPIALIIICVMGLLVGQAHTDPQVPKMSSNRPWRQLEMTRPRTAPVIDQLVIAATWGGLVAAVCWLYFRVYSKPPLEAYVSATLFGLLTIIPLGLAALYSWAIVTLGRPRVYIDVPYMTCDEVFHVRWLQPFRRRVRVRWLRLGLICMKEYAHHRFGRTLRGVRMDFQDFSQKTVNDSVEAGTITEFEETFHVPLDAEPSTPPQAWNSFSSLFYMRHFSWYIRVEVKFPRLPSLKADLPVRVQ